MWRKNYFSNCQRRDYQYLAVYAFGFALSIGLYNASLQGGDIKFAKDNMFRLTTYLMLSNIIILCLSVYSIFHASHIHFLVRILSPCVGWFCFLLLALSDLNTTLLRHGQYNFTCLAFLTIMELALLFLYKLLKFSLKLVKPRFFWLMVATLFLLYYYFWSVHSENAINNWNRGISSELQYSWANCNIELTSTPWMDILPDGTFNALLGSNECPSIGQFSTFQDGVLNVNCSSRGSIVKNPNFIDPHVDPFILEETGLKNWRGKSIETATNFYGDYSDKVDAEYFKVTCGEEENYYVQNIKKPKKKPENSKDRMNFLIFQIDALSRAHFLRKLTKTSEYLKTLNKSADLGVYEMMRLSAVGFNTELNTRAMYTGSQLRGNYSGTPFWKTFHSQGNAVLYLNGWCEDWSYRYLRKPMDGMDHFVFQPWCHPEYHPVNTTFSNFNGANSLRRRCIRGKYVHERIFDYLKDFWTNYQDTGKMAIVPLQEAHESSMEVVKTIDEGLKNLLKWFHDTGELAKTVVVLTSDHGSHMSFYYVFSSAGKLEHKMPGLFFIVPNDLIKKHPEIHKGLISNQQKLISHYDTHWTIRNIASFPEFGGGQAKPEKYTQLWDCQSNEKYIKDIWFFREKNYYNLDGWDDFEKVLPRAFEKIEECIRTYSDDSPKENPMIDVLPCEKAGFLGLECNQKVTIDKIPPCTTANCLYEVNVYDVIKDKDAYYWFLDAVFDLYLDTFPDAKARETSSKFSAPGNSRYRFGSSLFEELENRSCQQIGSLECPCSG